MTNKKHSKTFDDLKKAMLNTPEAVKAYEEYGIALELKHSLIEARNHANLSQAELAKKIKTSAPTVSRIENHPEHANMQTILKYIAACNAKINISF